jgi:hypothetical protein
MLDDIVASGDLEGELLHADGDRAARIGIAKMDIMKE